MSDDPRIVRDIQYADVERPVVPVVETVPPPPPAAVVVDAVAPPGAQHVTVARTARVSRFSPDAILAALVGIVMLVVGLIAVVRAGLDSDLREPVVNVLGFSHTALLGLIEVALGAALLLAGGMSSRTGAIFFGAVAGIAGFVGAVQVESFDRSLALERSMAWWVCVLGALVALAALVVPRSVTRTSDVRAI